MCKLINKSIIRQSCAKPFLTEGATTIPKGSTFKVKFFVWKCHTSFGRMKIWSTPLLNIGKPRVFRKEIDYLKTGIRWQITSNLRKHLKQLPYFLLFNYPSKLKKYLSTIEKNKLIQNKEDKLKLNAYKSPSPMNELCEYINEWEKKKILWVNKNNDILDTQCLVVNNDLDLSDRAVIKICRKFINQYAEQLKAHLKIRNEYFDVNDLTETFKIRVEKALPQLAEIEIANYIIKTSYRNLSISKSFAWSAYGEYIIKNLKNNTNPQRNMLIREVPYKTNNTYEYLGKNYEFEMGDGYRL